jgi:hypothetical protein
MGEKGWDMGVGTWGWDGGLGHQINSVREVLRKIYNGSWEESQGVNE